MSGAEQYQSGVISVRSRLSLAETIKNLLIGVERRGMIAFARIDHAKAAEETGHRLRPAQLFVFGYPEAEAPFIAKIPLIGIDFPQHVLVWEDDQGSVWLSYNDPVWLGRRHTAPADLFPKLEAIGNSLAGIAAEAIAVKSDITGA